MIVRDRHVIVAFRFLSCGFCFILLSLECYSAVDLWFAIDLQEGERKQARDNTNKHPADEKRPNHGRQLMSSVAGKAEKMTAVVHELMYIHATDE
jgi:hypothetical protein